MPNTQRTEAQNPIKQQVPGDNGRFEYSIFSGGTITYQAMLAMMQAELQAMNSMAQLNMVSINSRSKSNLTTASSTNSMYVDDANSLTQQSNEQWASVASSGMSFFGGAYGLAKTRGIPVLGKYGRSDAYSHLDNMDQLNDAAARFKKSSGNVIGAPTDTLNNGFDLETYNTFTNKLLSKGGISDSHCRQIAAMKNGFSEFDLRTLHPNYVGEELQGAPVTLKTVFEGAGAEELGKFRTSIAKAKTDATKQYTQFHTDIQTKTQILNSFVQAGQGTATSQFKLAEAQAMRDKGADSMTQSLSQNNADLAKGAADSQNSQSEKFSNMLGQSWQQISAAERQFQA